MPLVATPGRFGRNYGWRFRFRPLLPVIDPKELRWIYPAAIVGVY
jgi:hypothetical protein